jgi:hypothetical protein
LQFYKEEADSLRHLARKPRAIDNLKARLRNALGEGRIDQELGELIFSALDESQIHTLFSTGMPSVDS